MNLKRPIWYPIAVALSVVNVAAAGFAAGEPRHAAVHVALALAFGVWAQRLRPVAASHELAAGLDALEAVQALEGEVGRLRQELGEVQERLDFAERMLAMAPEARRVGSPPSDPEQPGR